MFNRLPALVRFLFALIAIDLVVFTAFRGAFWAAFHQALANASWALKELMPQSELWEVLPPHQTGENTLEQILRFKSRLEISAQAA